MILTARRVGFVLALLLGLYAVSPYWSAFWWLSSWADAGPGYWDRVNRPALRHSAMLAWKEALAARGKVMPSAAAHRLSALGDELIAPSEIAGMLYAGDPPGIFVGTQRDLPESANEKTTDGRHAGPGRFIIPFPHGEAWLTLGWSGWKVSAVKLITSSGQ